MLVRTGTKSRRERLAARLERPLVRIEYVGARLLALLPAGWQRRLAGGRPIEIDGDTLDPALQLILAVRQRLGVRPLAQLGPERARRFALREARVSAGPPPHVGAVRDLQVDGAEGPLPARHYAPAEPGGPHPLLVYFHGGGWVVGDLDTHDATCRLLCRHAGVHVLSVDYRLAPEHPFPAAVRDAGAAFAWACAHAAELGADPARVAVGGDSAGGNLAAVATRLAATGGGPVPVLQLLIYPATDLDAERPSLSLFAEGFYLTRADRDWYTETYLRGASDEDPLGSPLLAGALAGLPPAIVINAAFDPLRDEGEAYAQALREAGTPVLARRFPGLTHAFVNMTGIHPASRDAMVEVAGCLRGVLHLREASP